MTKHVMMLLAFAVAVTAGCATAQTPDELLAVAKDKEGYQPVFKQDLSNAKMEEGGWAFEDGVLVSKEKGDIWSKERYGDFVLSLEFRCAEETNSGVFIRCGSLEDWLNTCIEVQVLQPNDKYPNPTHKCGSIFDVLAPSKQMVKATGEWNHYYIVAKANKIYVWLNGEQIIDMDLDKWTEAHKNPDGTNNKFKYAYKDMPREGHIGLQYHGQPIAFRNIVIKPIK